ncbi:L-fucose transporter [Pseudopedobacter saltans DSM 12145]|uniref:L-fucose transporter n=1 Tax=Pseudopedobacter saltans (strain ATCC 51119 / DSM 12145 / JCM 21818 / CCUG 39354 / LMG 10337 / NBRC 100064 / NCIMB 13643) TaxID=762903 RepID=F0S4C2_PSESL|nr:L-fucose:H+ symporter permease [Pseudopedobacter saltans]ADY50879.1 L-fucose transporter [Pseudopedobacter saltans DSM 12145]
MSIITESQNSPIVNETGAASKTKYLIPFILVTTLFFLWGMAHNLDSILIPHLKKACQLNNRQSTLIDTAVFMAYFLMALPAGMILKKWGYKNSLLLGLLIFSAGAFLFVPAANTRAYELFLIALFIIGCGLTLLETAANPYAAVLGPKETSTFRLNLAASFNGLAAMVAPIVGALFILSGQEHTADELAAMSEVDRLAYLNFEAGSVKMPYIILGTFLLVVALLFYFIKFPEVKVEDDNQGEKRSLWAALKHKHLSWAVVSQFFYVGAQVCVTSFFIRMAQQGANFDERTAGYWLGVYGLLFMGGRFVGTFLMRIFKPNVLLAIFAVCAALLSIVAITGEGVIVIYALGGLGFFMSIMFPTIFALGITDLGEETKAGSSWLIMSIVGGAILPYIMGTIIDLNHDNIQIGYFIPFVCYLIILYFALIGHKVRNKVA